MFVLSLWATVLWSPDNGTKCERKILAYKKNKSGLIITILYINSNEECIFGFKARLLSIR